MAELRQSRSSGFMEVLVDTTIQINGSAYIEDCLTKLNHPHQHRGGSRIKRLYYIDNIIVVETCKYTYDTKGRRYVIHTQITHSSTETLLDFANKDILVYFYEYILHSPWNSVKLTWVT